MLDSGVFFTGPPYQRLKAWKEQKLEVVVSPSILEEHRRVGEKLSEQFPEVNLSPILEWIVTKALIFRFNGIAKAFVR